MLAAGGSAADAIVGAAAVMAVVGPHLCGLGGDALAMVGAPGRPPEGLLGVGRSGSGADPDRLRADGHDDMPLRADIRSVPVPGAVDGWLALHDRYGRLLWAQVLEPAIALAEEGFAASLILVFASTLVRDVPGADDLCPPGGLDVGQRVRRPGLARTLRALATDGRDGFYGGAFGHALLAVGAGEYSPDDLERALSGVGGARGAAGHGPRPVDRATAVAGVPDAGGHVGGRADGAPHRHRRPPVGARGGRSQPCDGRGPPPRPL